MPPWARGEDSRGLLRGSFERSWGLFWGFFAPLGGSLGPLGCLKGASWGCLGASWVLRKSFVGRSAGIRSSWSLSWALVGTVLEISWAV
eukprot:347975-Pyramimonas_sp.AAC.1